MGQAFSLFATPVPADFATLTTRALAALSHRAEDTADDVLLLQVDDEIQRRERAMPGILAAYQLHYMDLWRQRAAPAEAPR